MHILKGIVSAPDADSINALEVLSDLARAAVAAADGLEAREAEYTRHCRETKGHSCLICPSCRTALENGVICGKCFHDFRYPSFIPEFSIFSEETRKEVQESLMMRDEIKKKRGENPDYMRGVQVDAMTLEAVK